MTSEANSAQAEWWNAAGEGWANAQDVVGLVLQPFQDTLVARATQRPRTRVLDVGCGTGAVTRGIAEATNAECTGVDIAESMLKAAVQRGGAEYIRADAQVHTFDRQFDLVVSRFGVMFFDDTTAAFRNLLKATTPGGELCFVTWRTSDENPFMATGSKAAARYFPDAPPPDPDGPGPNRLADPDKTRRILEEAGWTNVAIEPLDRTCTMPENLLTTYLSNLGPIARAMKEAEDPGKVMKEVRSAFDGFVHGDEVRIPGACWQVTASAPL
ncbi:class I SAM-dependent methyltransferase [Lentzea sp. NPDC058450]|uniref:class I SAM-dependent methyltransferase n=1 Tax=Lentzea sp. NPDC058450 TaxID=3346505 RepID=UPI003659718E